MDRRKDKDVERIEAQEEPKIIADIKIHQKKVDHRQAYLEDYNTCPLCGTELQFTHLTDFTYWLVEEEASCPACSIRTKQETHSLQ